MSNLLSQRLAALRLAQAERQQSAAVLRKIRTGTLRPEFVLRDTQTSLKVARILKATPGVADVKTKRVMQRAHLHQDARARALTERQINAVIAALHEVAPCTAHEYNLEILRPVICRRDSEYEPRASRRI